MWASSRRPLSSLEMAVVEQNTVALGVTIDALMENAGRASAEEATRHLPSPPGRVAVIAGTGNNGGDGTCATFYLQQWGYSPEIWLVRPPVEIRSRAAQRCFERVKNRVPVRTGIPRPEDLATMPLVIDALLGTGQSGRLRSPVREAVAAIRASGAPVLSLDVPTGIMDPDGLRPTWTVTFTIRKDEMEEGKVGELTVRDIGLPANSWRETGPGEFLFFPEPKEPRGRNGRLVVIGGGPYTGAPALAAMAAMRSGAERATVITPEAAAGPVRSFSPNLIVWPVGSDRFRPTDVPAILDIVRSNPPGAVVLGMGAGAHPETTEALRAVIEALATELPLVVDADGLAALFAGPGDLLRPPLAGVIATPNIGEFERVLHGPAHGSFAERSDAAARIALERHLTLVVKGSADILTDGETTIGNPHHHLAMTVGGVGDVLAGVLGSLLAQKVRPLHAARLATFWTGEAGLRAAAHRGFGIVATDVIEELPAALVVGLQRLARSN
ncbi:MAG: NAD(P)H-hydrate dehydratase [Thermoplasmata archaeon]|jgi:ADP-dependent NAD(P)H-hydrate dehydratase / NAD(P)H-hydrate epimerase